MNTAGVIANTLLSLMGVLPVRNKSIYHRVYARIFFPYCDILIPRGLKPDRIWIDDVIQK